jgi:lysine 2,3-aminomutase
LLKGVNDSVDALVRLCSGLQRIRVRPYYVFIGDPVAGTAHFRVSAKRAVELADALAQRVGGLAMPRFVADIPGAPAKTAVQDLVR